MTTTTHVGGDIGGPAAYSITNLIVGGTTYNVNFDYGSFYGLYGNPPAAGTYAGSLADQIGAAILGTLAAQSPAITKLVPANIAGFGSNILTEFFIPKSEIAQNSNQDTFLQCFTSDGTCPDKFRDPAQTDSVLFARFTEVPTISTPVPTPALLPGLMGVGLAVLRKKNQSKMVDG